MGAFRSKPIVDKFSKDEENHKLRCAVSIMQGWRLTQEDCYNFILDYDKDSSFFAVYDGHGGNEVAEYLSRNLPKFLKDLESYKEGDIEKTLIDGFLKMDASLITPEIMAILKEIAMEGLDVEDEEEENINTLYEEACMPVEKVIEKYRDGEVQCNSKTKEGSSKSGDIDNEAGCSKERPRRERTRRNVCDNSDSQEQPVKDNSDESHGMANEIQNNLKKIVDTLKTIEELNNQSKDKHDDKSELSDKSKANNDDKSEKVEEKSNENNVVNGEASPENNPSEKHPDNSQDQKDETSKEKGKSLVKRITPITIEKICSEALKSDDEIYKMFLKRYVDNEEESEDSESSDGSGDDDEQNESENGTDDNEDDEDEDNNDDNDEEDEEKESEEEGEEETTLRHRDFEDEKPGVNSGSTAIVSLLKGNLLYVANVGDSRCVVCREGKAVEMSEDHKPRNAGETQRIKKAGGTIDYADDRVDGGLNMSRAFGDYCYKDNDALSQTEQKVIALPDVKKLTIDPDKDEFMVLASDGIWNVKSCQKVIDFLRPKVLKGDGKLSSCIEELFDECLSEHSFSNGCDNMTTIIVQFKPNLKRSSSPLAESNVKKSKSENVTKEPV